MKSDTRNPDGIFINIHNTVSTSQTILANIEKQTDSLTQHQQETTNATNINQLKKDIWDNLNLLREQKKLVIEACRNDSENYTLDMIKRINRMGEEYEQKQYNWWQEKQELLSNIQKYTEDINQYTDYIEQDRENIKDYERRIQEQSSDQYRIYNDPDQSIEQKERKIAEIETTINTLQSLIQAISENISENLSRKNELKEISTHAMQQLKEKNEKYDRDMQTLKDDIDSAREENGNAIIENCIFTMKHVAQIHTHIEAELENLKKHTQTQMTLYQTEPHIQNEKIIAFHNLQDIIHQQKNDLQSATHENAQTRFLAYYETDLTDDYACIEDTGILVEA